jgi:hypothetical protein
MSIAILLGATGFYLYYRESAFLDKYNILIENVLNTQQLDRVISYNSDILQKYKATESRNYIAQMNANKEMADNIINSLNDNVDSKKVADELKLLKNATAQYTRVVNSIILSDEGSGPGT